MPNLLQVQNALVRVERIAKVFEEAISIRLHSLLTERDRRAIQDSDEARSYEKGFKDGLNAGLRISRVELADLDVGKICEALDGDLEGE